MNKLLNRIGRTRAITMWDFSWLERRWPGAGYENIDQALDELAERGYDAIRIDAFPHLVAAGAEAEWELIPCWNTQDWGSPALNRVRVQPHLNEFLAACAARKMTVGLSSWYRDDRTQQRMKIITPEDQADNWIATLRSIDPALHATILYVDLCNEWPQEMWAPYFLPGTPNSEKGHNWTLPISVDWIQRAARRFRAAFPDMPVTMSAVHSREKYLLKSCPPEVDFLEPHLWIPSVSDFYQRVGYNYDRFSPASFERLVAGGEALYRSDPAHWLGILRGGIEELARCGRTYRLPLITTECWSMVDYKDGPLLDWGWIKEITAQGTEWAVGTGAWAAIATSNFCGPQFRGMWRDVAWHQRLTKMIRSAPLPTLAPA